MGAENFRAIKYFSIHKKITDITKYLTVSLGAPKTMGDRFRPGYKTFFNLNLKKEMGFDKR